MIKTFTAIAALAAFTSLPATAAPTKMTSEMLDQIVAGTYEPCPPTIKVHADNGWGNGADGTNPGSFHGGTSPSKIAGFNLLSPPNKINTNPTFSTGR